MTTKVNVMCAIGCDPYSVQKCITNCNYELYTLYICRNPEDLTFTRLSQLMLKEGLAHLEFIEQWKSFYFSFCISQNIE